uniref:E3 SUMO-protein ligase NSE2 n=1 Tax=Nothobranchius furzeri TaxID=105023 RepID=A0A8C6KUF6_NOTFU
MSVSAVHGTLSSLKSCQAELGTGMDIVTDVAMDLVETREMNRAIKELEAMMLECDIAVTQSQVNFTCPLTQVEMENPVKNKKCNHHYDKNAILGLIKTRNSQKKKCRCPVVGCANTDVRPSDLIQDQLLAAFLLYQCQRI